MELSLHVKAIYRNITMYMGTSKTLLFSEHHIKLAELAKAMAHPARIAIMEYLIQKGSCVCGDIVEALPLSQATVSQHLKAMKKVGLIKGDIEGVYRCYCIDPDKCTELMDRIKSLFGGFTGCC